MKRGYEVTGGWLQPNPDSEGNWRVGCRWLIGVIVAGLVVTGLGVAGSVAGATITGQGADS
ncbi:MAG: hypothetical protein ACRDT6_14675 [Micromonosporaceae bacterium]